MLKKLDEFNKRITKVLIIINIFMIFFDFIGIFVSDEFEKKISFLSYMGLHTALLFFFLWIVKKDPKEKE